MPVTLEELHPAGDDAEPGARVNLPQTGELGVILHHDPREPESFTGVFNLHFKLRPKDIR